MDTVWQVLQAFGWGVLLGVVFNFRTVKNQVDYGGSTWPFLVL